MNNSERIKHAIEKSGVSQADIARECGVSKAAVTQWVSGDTKKFKAEYIFAIARATGVSAEWLATGKEPETIKLHGSWGDGKTKIDDALIAKLVDQNTQILAALGVISKQLERVVVPKTARVGDNFEALPDAPLEAIETLKGLIDKGGKVEADKPAPRNIRIPKKAKAE